MYMSNVIITILFDIYSVLNEEKLYFYVVWFVRKLWFVQPAMEEASAPLYVDRNKQVYKV